MTTKKIGPKHAAAKHIAEPAAPTIPADGWYTAALSDGERVMVAVSGGGTAFTLHREAGGCRDVPGELVAAGYFKDWQAVK